MPTVNIDADLSKENLTVNISAPWGEFKCETILSFVQQLIAQLESFLPTSSDPKFTEYEIEGYKQVVATGREDLADLFLQTKGVARENGTPFKSNFDVIAFLTEKGRWI
jgi:hypothetical protein